MNLRTYQAYSMSEALNAVKRELGADAVILNTRTFKRGGILGIGKQTIVEVTATTAQDSAHLPRTKKQPNANIALRAYEQTPPKIQSQPKDPGAIKITSDDRVRTKRLAQAMLEQFSRKKQLPEETQKNQSVDENPGERQKTQTQKKHRKREKQESSGIHEISDNAHSDQVTPLASVAQRFVLKQPDPSPEESGRAEEATFQPQIQDQSDEPALPSKPESMMVDHDGQRMSEELAAIKNMVGTVLQRQTVTTEQTTPTMPQKLFDMYLKLIAQDLSQELADQIVNEVRDELPGPMLEDETAIREAIMRRLTTYIPVADEAVTTINENDDPRIIALVGPTGVGKTTTLAKLAAAFKLRQKKSVGLITSDTYRIAAVDQLRTYANIIGLPLKVVLTPSEMQQAIHALGYCDVILIDTAGRSQNDQSRIADLAALMDAAEPHEIHLVLSSTAGEKVLLREAEAFSQVNVDKIVLTKLDEAVSFGVLVDVIRKVGKELSFFTTGQEVPEHIETSRADRLAALVMGEEVILH